MHSSHFFCFDRSVLQVETQHALPQSARASGLLTFLFIISFSIHSLTFLPTHRRLCSSQTRCSRCCFTPSPTAHRTHAPSPLSTTKRTKTTTTTVCLQAATVTATRAATPTAATRLPLPHPRRRLHQLVSRDALSRYPPPMCRACCQLLTATPRRCDNGSCSSRSSSGCEHMRSK